MNDTELNEQTIAAFAAWKKDNTIPIEESENGMCFQRWNNGPTWKGKYARVAPFTDRLTCAQVGTKDGWRLLDADEAEAPHSKNAWRMTEYRSYVRGWVKSENQDGESANGGTYRTRLTREQLAALDEPKPAFRDWNCAEDVPFPWPILRNVKGDGDGSLMSAILSVSSYGINVASKSEVKFMPFTGDWKNREWSQDGKTWQPCKVEVAK